MGRNAWTIPCTSRGSVEFVLVATCLVLLLTVFPCGSFATNQAITIQAIEDINFGDTPDNVFHKVFIDKHIQYLNPMAQSPLGPGRLSSGFPNRRSVFLTRFGERTFQLKFNFCDVGFLCRIQLLGSSVEGHMVDSTLREQHQFLVQLVRFHNGSPTDTHAVNPGDTKREDEPAWSHVWKLGRHKPIIKIGYAWNRNMVQSGKEIRISTRSRKLRTKKGYFAVLMKELPETETMFLLGRKR